MGFDTIEINLVVVVLLLIIIYLATLNKNRQGAAKVQILWSVDLLPQLKQNKIILHTTLQNKNIFIQNKDDFT